MGKKNKNKITESADNVTNVQKIKKIKHLNSEASDADVNKVAKKVKHSRISKLLNKVVIDRVTGKFKVKRKKRDRNVSGPNDVILSSNVELDSKVKIKQIKKTDKHINDVDVNLISGPTRVKKEKRDKNINGANNAIPTSNAEQDLEVKIKQTNKIDEHENNDDINLVSTQTKVKRAKKAKKISEVNNAVATNAEEVEINQTNKIYKQLNDADVNLVRGPTKGKRNKNNISGVKEAMPKNKKTKFKDDEKIENNPQVIKKQFLSKEEAAVTEEDIDEFCDGLEDVENEQFDEWIRLLDKKLNNRPI